MSLDPRTPVLVGGGQINGHDGAEPVDLMAAAARAAAAEAGSELLLEQVDTVWVVRLLSWRYRDPGLLVAERVGAASSLRRTGYSGNGGSTPQVMVNAAAADILAGRADVVLIGGAESWRTRMKFSAAGERPVWTKQDESVLPAPIIVPDVPMEAESERRVGIDRPSYVYPLFDQARRISAGQSIADRAQEIGRLWSSFSRVAAGNPHAWVRKEYGPDELITPSPGNRMIASPYPKLLNSNNMVDQGAALLMCSVAKARELGIDPATWVFPHAGTEAHDTDAIAARGALDRSPAIRIGAREALAAAGLGIGDIEFIDIYSCFPSAVAVAAAEIGLPLDDPARPLTCTGGLTFAGGPWNNYSTHAIATVTTRLRENPGSYGLVTANSGYLTKHAFGIYGATPPAEPFARRDVQELVDAEPVATELVSYAGAARIESWTVVYGRDGLPEKAFVAAAPRDGERALAVVTGADDVAVLAAEDVAGRSVTIGEDGGAVLGCSN